MFTKLYNLTIAWLVELHSIAVLSIPSACLLIIATCPCTVLRLERHLKLGILCLNGGNCVLENLSAAHDGLCSLQS